MLDILPSQVRAARALLSWSQEELATFAEVGVSTVRDFEAGRRDPASANVNAMRKALTKFGVIFIPLDKHGGPGVRLESDVPKIIRRPMGVSFETDTLPFKVRWRGSEIHVFLPKTVLDDKDRTDYSGDAAYLAAFERWEELILQCVAYAIYSGRIDQQGRLHLRSGDFFGRGS